jgi:hypothetical protein
MRKYSTKISGKNPSLSAFSKLPPKEKEKLK